MTDFKEKAAILWQEGFLCRESDQENEELVERRWNLRETVPQTRAKEVKERARFQKSMETEEDDLG